MHIVRKLLRSFCKSICEENQAPYASDKPDLIPPDSLLQLLKKADAAELVTLDREIRQGAHIWASGYGAEWHGMSEARVEQIPQFYSNALICGLYSFHYNGFIREPAVVALSAIETGAELPFLLLRLDDWVPEIRARVLHALAWRIKPQNAQKLLDNLPLLLRISSRERALSSETLSGALRLVATLATGEHWKLGLKHSDVHARLWWFEQLFKNLQDVSGEELDQIAFQQLHDSDPRIRFVATSGIRRSGRLTPEHPFMEVMLRDSSARVRREAVECLVELDVIDSEIVNRLLVDKSVWIRREAQSRLASKSETEPLSWYRNQLIAGRLDKIAIILQSIGELGDASDAQAIRRFWNDPRPGVQRAAVVALSNLDPNLSPFELLAKLASEFPGVSREAEQALTTRIHQLPLNLIWQLFDTTTMLHVRRNALRLLSSAGKWKSIRFLILALRPVYGQEMDLHARHLYTVWWDRYNHYWASPTHADLDAITEAIDAHQGGGLHAWFTKDFNSIISEWRQRLGPTPE